MKQYEAVIETLDKLGGVATLGELNREVFKISDCEWKTKTPFASIRRIVQQTKGIYKIKPGLYGLEKYRKQIEDRGIIVETEKNKDSNDVIMFNHTYYQGIWRIISVTLPGTGCLPGRVLFLLRATPHNSRLTA